MNRRKFMQAAGLAAAAWAEAACGAQESGAAPGEPVLGKGREIQPEHIAQNYLHEAAQAEKPPSGKAYASASLGVHEHWDSPGKKRYARNRGAKRASSW